MITFDQFISKWNGKGINFDNAYGNQCVDLYRQYLKEVLGVPQSPPVKGAADIWDTIDTNRFIKIENTPLGIPQKGDIMIWKRVSRLPFGHVGVYISGNLWSFNSFDQNWPSQGYYSNGNFIGTGVCHSQGHNYLGSYPLKGWLRLKATPPTPTPPLNDHEKNQKVRQIFGQQISEAEQNRQARDVLNG